MRNVLWVPVVVASYDSTPEHLVDGATVGKVIRFEHVGEEVNRRPLAFVGPEHSVEGLPVSREDLGDLRTPVELNVINQKKVVGRLVSKKASRWHSQFLLIAGRYCLA
jgi:hypothetical protein